MENMEKVINPTKTRQNHQLFVGSLCDWASSKKRPRHLVPRYLALDVEVMISLKATSGHANTNLGARHIPKVSFRLLFLRRAKMGCNPPLQTAINSFNPDLQGWAIFLLLQIQVLRFGLSG